MHQAVHTFSYCNSSCDEGTYVPQCIRLYTLFPTVTVVVIEVSLSMHQAVHTFSYCNSSCDEGTYVPQCIRLYTLFPTVTVVVIKNIVYKSCLRQLLKML